MWLCCAEWEGLRPILTSHPTKKKKGEGEKSKTATTKIKKWYTYGCLDESGKNAKARNHTKRYLQEESIDSQVYRMSKALKLKFRDRKQVSSWYMWWSRLSAWQTFVHQDTGGRTHPLQMVPFLSRDPSPDRCRRRTEPRMQSLADTIGTADSSSCCPTSAARQTPSNSSSLSCLSEHCTARKNQLRYRGDRN